MKGSFEFFMYHFVSIRKINLIPLLTDYEYSHELQAKVSFSLEKTNIVESMIKEVVKDVQKKQ